MKELQTELNKWLNEWEEKATMDLRNKIPFFMQHCAGYYDIVAGTSPLLLPKAKANGLDYVKAFGKCEQTKVPSGYTQYEYLRSSGTQYIDLGYKGNENTKVEVKFKYYQTSSATGSGRVFGSRTTATSNAFAIGTSSGVVGSTNNKIFWCYDGQPFYVDDTEFGLDVWNIAVFSAKEHSINGVSVGDDYEIVDFETPNNLKLFGFDQQSGTGVGYVDIAYCKLWNNGVLVRDLVPAGDGSINSMYDKVSGTMLPNAGTGNFGVGNEIIPTPDTPVDIVCNNGVLKVSPNLFSSTPYKIGYYIDASGQEQPATQAQDEYIIRQATVQPSTTYTLSFVGTSTSYTQRFHSYDANGNWISQIAAIASSAVGSTSTQTFTTPANCKYIRQGGRSQSNYQLEQGSRATPYMAYGQIYAEGTTETISDSLNNTATAQNLFSVNDYKDEQEILSGTVMRNVGVKVLDGTEEWTASGNLFYAGIATDALEDTHSCYCTHFKGVATNASASYQNEIKVGTNATQTINWTRVQIYPTVGAYSNVAAFKSWLADQYAAGTPVIVIYPLQTATTETAAGQTLNTKEGSNSLTITQASLEGLTLEARYKRGR